MRFVAEGKAFTEYMLRVFFDSSGDDPYLSLCLTMAHITVDNGSRQPMFLITTVTLLSLSTVAVTSR